jgi:phospholipid/cholesterol/gamma-HCH transport system substrate-binding protein
MRGRNGGISGNPVLIGAATILVVVVAVFLAYNANAGLPFVPTYSVKAELPSGANLVVGNDVRIGGSRVGAVDDIQAKRLRNGRTIAVVSMKLEKDVQPLPKDSTLLVRPRSALGLKYVEITRGHERAGWADGATIPLRYAGDPVEFDDLVSMFDDKTRRAAQVNTLGFGNGFAGRGQSINMAIGAFKPLLRDIIPVSRNLRAPDTHLVRMFQELGDAARIVAPAAETQARLFVNLDTTFGALAKVARPFIQDSITTGRPALDAGIRDFPQVRPFMRNTQVLFHLLRPGVRALRKAAPALSSALVIGTPVLRATPPLNHRLKALLVELRRFSEDPMVPQGIKALDDAVTTLKPTLDFLAPAQTQCNYVTLWFRNVSSLLSEGDSNGTWQRFTIIPTPQGPNSEGGQASKPANGPTVENHLHTNPYPHTAAPGQPKECEAGNEPYIIGKTITSNVPGTQAAHTEGNP